MKARAKHNCHVTLTTSLQALSLNRLPVFVGEEFDLPVYEDTTFTDEKVIAVLGNRSVVFIKDGLLIPTYAKDFEYF